MPNVVRPGAFTRRPPAPKPQTPEQPHYANPEAEKIAEKLQLGRLRTQNHQLRQENEALKAQQENINQTLAYYHRQMAYLAQVQQDNAEMAERLAELEKQAAQVTKLEVALETTEAALRKEEAAHQESIKEINHLAAKVSELQLYNQRFAAARDERMVSVAKDMGALREENELLKSELGKAKETLELADKALAEAKTAENHLTSEIRELRHQLELANQNYANLSSRYEHEMAQAVHNMKDAESRHRIYDDKMHADNHALADELAAAKRKIAELQDMIRSSIDNPAIITTPWGNKPISSEGMRFLLDKAIYYHRKYHALEGAHVRLVKRSEGAIHCLTDPHFPDKIKLQGEE